ncbi:MAG: hypothetical protein D6738_14905, partial [Acidobacteria bacterium]
WQWSRVAALLPGPARLCLALMTTTLLVSTVALLALAVAQARVPSRAVAPWLAAIAAGCLVALAVTGSIRRIEFDRPRALSIPGFAAERSVVILEIPALDPADLRLYDERGHAETLGRLVAGGSIARIREPRIADPVALHGTLITGRPARAHGILGAVRYRPATGRRSFGILPRGLLLRPLLRTPLWERVPVDRRVLRVAALPQIARGLGVPMARIGDPLDWKAGPGELEVADPRLVAGARFVVAGREIVCPAPAGTAERYFDPPAETLEATPRLERVVADALVQDLCALELAQAAVAAGRWPLVHVRLGGHYRVAYEFAGWRADRRARGATEDEVRAYGLTLTRYVRDLDPALGRLVDALPADGLFVLVSPHGIRPRTDFERLLASLFGRTTATGSHRGPPDGVIVLRGAGVRRGHRHAGFPVRSVLPTVLWAAGLPAAEDMGPLVTGVFEESWREGHPVIAIPSFDAPRPRPAGSGRADAAMLE